MATRIQSWAGEFQQRDGRERAVCPELSDAVNLGKPRLFLEKYKEINSERSWLLKIRFGNWRKKSKNWPKYIGSWKRRTVPLMDSKKTWTASLKDSWRPQTSCPATKLNAKLGSCRKDSLKKYWSQKKDTSGGRKEGSGGPLYGNSEEGEKERFLKRSSKT